MDKKENKTIEIRIRFWTNDLPGVPKNYAHAGGMVTAIADKTKGISSSVVAFHGLNDLPKAVHKAAKRAGIRLVI